MTGNTPPGRRYVSPCCNAMALPTPSGRYYCMRCTWTVPAGDVTQVPETPQPVGTPERPAGRAGAGPGQMTLF